MLIASPVAAKTKRHIEKIEDNLTAAGFLAKPANTPERVDMLTRLPANTFVQRANGDAVTYVYADPKVCACLYVGTQDAYAQYLRDMQDRRLADQQTLAAQTYADARWNWGGWGPWGSHWGFGPYGW
ncbi:hypothetical protein FMM06_03280 [Glacieibacterium frigidum]|uniref:Uncharacterized protein n=2 Tax=Glacieibacterium frigidum TaxID=2593303 RepID=A0A552UJK2_9SPHN|nr:hypothetical protein FMM06_03280 [Glacieibacterium frigidum]